jgi:NAD(P)-dependent dehydrogenase (short-subunit alcohol dehydrogenase family)
LADDGFDVAVNDMPAHEEKLDHLVDEIKAKGRTSSKHIANVSLDEQVRKMVEQVVQQLGGLDVVRHPVLLDSNEYRYICSWLQTPAFWGVQI